MEGPKHSPAPRLGVLEALIRKQSPGDAAGVAAGNSDGVDPFAVKEAHAKVIEQWVRYFHLELLLDAKLKITQYFFMTT